MKVYMYPVKPEDTENHILFSGTYPVRPNSGLPPQPLRISTQLLLSAVCFIKIRLVEPYVEIGFPRFLMTNCPALLRVCLPTGYRSIIFLEFRYWQKWE